MRNIAVLLAFFLPLLSAETHPLTLQQALDLAARQNPDVALAHLDQQRAEQGIRVARDPFRPKVYGGSGLAYTYGYPNSIDGNAPSLFEAKTDMALYNKPKMFELAAAKESAHGSEFGSQAKSNEVAFRTASLFLDARQAEHEVETMKAQIPGLHKVIDVMASRVEEGAELPLELKRTKVNLGDATQRLDAMRLDGDYYEMMLAVTLGFPPADRVKPVDSPLPAAIEVKSEQEASDIALRNNKELRQIQSNVAARELELRGYRASRLPQVNIVAQYALFAKYNYAQYFQKFQRNNGQLGASITIPLLVGSASAGLADQAITDMHKLRIQMDQVRDRVTSNTRRSFQEWQKAKDARENARLHLDLAREELNLLLAQNGEGQVPMSRVEQARIEESNRWLVLYESDTQVARAQLAILREMGTLMAVLHAQTPEPQP